MSQQERTLAIEECARVADLAALNDDSYALQYPDEAVKYKNRSHRAKTIAAAIRRLDETPRT